MTITHALRKLLWKAGLDICRFSPASHDLARRQHLITVYGIDTVLDVGANYGQFGLQLRRDLSYTRQIFSFEPLSSAYALLERNARNDPAWTTFNFAIGDRDEQRLINVSQNSVSSSLFDMLPSHLSSAPDSLYVGEEVIRIKKLDSIFSGLCTPADNVYLKIDVQGFEQKVLQGAENSLPYINTVQVEMSLVPLYEGGLLFNELCDLMLTKGYTLVGIENGFADASGQLLQVDGIFRRL